MEKAVRVYTDGGSVPNPGRGAWAALLVGDGVARYLSGYDPDTTNNRMELAAAINALRAFNRGTRVEMHTDSMYVKDGIEKWIKGWKTNNWIKKSDKKPVLNQDLWRALDKEIEAHEVRWSWVRAHADDRYNNFVDWLVQDTINNKQGVDKKQSVDDLERYIDTLKLRIRR